MFGTDRVAPFYFDYPFKQLNMKKLFFAIALLMAASFSLKAQHLDIENGSTESILVEAGRNMGCATICSNFTTVSAASTATLASCNTNTTLQYGKIWVGEPNTTNGVYLGLCAGDAGSFTHSSGATINVAFSDISSSNPNAEIIID